MAYVPLTVSIPEPCSVPWSGMTPVSDMERHCASCDKVITDFSMLSDAQIGRTLKANGGRLCGRFRRDQLDRPLRLNGPRRRRGLGPVAAAASMLLAVPAFGQTAEPVKTVQAETVRNPQSVISESQITLRGVVTDEQEEPLIGATILLKGTTSGTFTDIDGRYELVVPSDVDITLVVTYIGFETKEISYTASEVSAASKTATPIVVTNELWGDIIAGGLAYYYDNSPSLLESLMNHTIPTFTPDRPLGPAKGDWKAYWRERFAARKARRQQRKAERLARREARKADNETIVAEKPLEVSTPESKTVAPAATFSLSASPNPFQHELTVSFTLPTDQRIHLELLDASGRQLFHWQQDGFAGKQTITLKRDFSGLTPGLYVLRLVDERGKVESVRLVR